MVMPSCGGNLVWRPSLGRRAGYSLFEVLVALAILALAASLTLPSLTAGLGAAARGLIRLEVEQAILALRRRAVREGETLYVAPGRTFSELTLRNTWLIEPETVITISSDGRCTGGALTARSLRNEETIHIGLDPENCRVIRQ